MDIIKQLSEELNIEESDIIKVYGSFWQFIRDNIQKLPLKDSISEEDFNKLKTNFNIPKLGKMSCTYNRYKNCKKKYEITNKIHENKKD